jgi:2-(1,2-epoxy-1,2-dihydrophenyl)acetyl-CoA isomerase
MTENTTTTSTVEVEVREGVAFVTLSRPDAANSMNLQFGHDILRAALRCEADPSIRAVVLTGAGKNFCFGGDLRGMASSGGDAAGYLTELTTHLHAAIVHFTRMNAPVIAAVNGTAAGAGLGLALMADMAIAGASAKFAPAYTGVGLTPDGSTTFLLPRAIGYKRAMELFLTNRVLTAEEALAWGLVNQVVPDEELLAVATRLATRLAAGPLHAFGQTKRLMADSEPGLEAQVVRESRSIAAAGSSAEGREGIAAFLEKRKAEYR